MLAYVLLARKIDASTEKLLNMLQDILVLMRSNRLLVVSNVTKFPLLSIPIVLQTFSNVDY